MKNNFKSCKYCGCETPKFDRYFLNVILKQCVRVKCPICNNISTSAESEDEAFDNWNKEN